MFGSNRAKYPTDSFSKHRAGKSTSKSKKSFKESSFSRRPAHLDLSSSKQHPPPATGPDPAALNSAIITIAIGRDPPRLFAAHVDVLNVSPVLQSQLRSQFYSSTTRQLHLPDEVAEVFSCVLEFLYKGDYNPKLAYDSRRGVWSLEHAAESPGNIQSTIWIPSAVPSSPNPNNPTSGGGMGAHILRDTAVYCSAEKYSLPNLKRLALRKQGLQSGVPVATILASARFAYANTPENDSKLRAHYLALIIRSRNTFKKSGTMQVEMGMASPTHMPPSPTGTGLWFDLFVAMCNHLDDMEQIVKSPR